MTDPADTVVAVATGTEPTIFRHPRRVLITAAVLGVAVALAGVVVSAHHRLGVDTWWADAARDARTTWLVDGAKGLDRFGDVAVQTVVRVAVTIVLVARAWWRRLGAWVFVAVLTTPIGDLVKAIVERPRPPAGLVHAGGTSFPSGHSLAAAVTGFGIALALTRPGRARLVAFALAGGYVAAMAASRTILAVHWLTDVIAGAGLGLALTLAAFAVAQLAGRRRAATLVAALVFVVPAAACTTGDGAASDRVDAAARRETTTTSTTAPAPPTTTTTTLVPADGKTAADRTMTLEHEISGDLTPKSVVWSGGDRFFAQNMIYTHTIGVYDRAYDRVALIPDTVNLAQFGYPQYTGASYQGGPVEADFTPDGKYAYVSNYQMYGDGFGNPGYDNCPQGDYDPSFVYRVDVAKLAIDQVIEVGAVPKYVQVTPDGRYVLVTNWCGYDLSVIDAATAKEVTRLPIGRYPRGIVVSPDSRTAYVAIMGGTGIAVVDLTTLQVTGQIGGVGSAPRHLVLSPDGSTLYVTLNGEGDVAKVDLATGSVTGRVATGQAPRSMDISDDGTALYVVNYESGTMSKVRTADMTVLQSVPTNQHPIGITYDAASRHVWVANYSGTLQIFDDA